MNATIIIEKTRKNLFVFIVITKKTWKWGSMNTKRKKECDKAVYFKRNLLKLKLYVVTLALGSQSKQGPYLQRCRPKVKIESHISYSREWRNVRKWTHILPSGLPLWELESRWTSESLEGDYRGQNSLDWKIPYTIRKLLRHKCLKWACMDHMGYLKHKLWSKEGPKVKLAVWLPIIKSQNRPDLLTCRWHAAYLWKALNKGYNFFLDLISIEGLHKKLWASKVAGIPISRIFELSTWES
jgi:hypothetical protein